MKPTTKAVAASAAVATAISLATPFIAKWEGVWTTAQIDRIGTGQPVTVCYGATRADIPNLQVGQKFTVAQCQALLEKHLPKYEQEIAPCVHAKISPMTRASLISMSYNAGPGAVCKSNVVALLNAGKSNAACEAIKTWYVRARGVVVKGLVNRRADESRLCAAGLKQVAEKRVAPVERPWWQRLAAFLTFRPLEN